MQGTIFIYHVYVRWKHHKSQCLLYWKYSKLLRIRTLIKLSYHTSSVEAVHSQVIFFFYLTFILLFSFVIVGYWKLQVEDKVNKVVVVTIVVPSVTSWYASTFKTKWCYILYNLITGNTPPKIFFRCSLEKKIRASWGYVLNSRSATREPIWLNLANLLSNSFF